MNSDLQNACLSLIEKHPLRDVLRELAWADGVCARVAKYKVEARQGDTIPARRAAEANFLFASEQEVSE